VISPGDWVLAIDFGTTNTVAATTDASGTLTPSVNGRQVTPSAVFLDPSTRSWTVGETAIRTARRRLDSFEPNPKRGVPDGTLFLGGHDVPVGDAITAVLAPIVQEVTKQHGNRPPAAFYVTHPANWGQARVNVLVTAATKTAGRGWPAPQPLSEPIAAAQAILGMADIPQQARLVVLDLGGGTVDAAVVDRDGSTLTVVGEPQGRDGIGGEDYDQRLARWMVAEVGAPGLYDRLAASDDPDLRERAVQIRVDARNAKEELSFHTSVPTQLPKSPPDLPEITPVLVSRPQLEALIRGGPDHEPGLIESVDVVRSVLVSIPPGPRFVGVFLTGGCSRIPMLGALIQESTGRPPLTFGDPTMAVATGASQFGWKQLAAPPPPPPPPPPPMPPTFPPGSPDPRTEPPPERPPRRGQFRRLAILAAAFLAAGGLVTGIALAATSNHTPPPPPPPPPSTTQPATTQPATQPATTQPATTQPATTQPATTQPATTQPATTQPATGMSFNFSSASQYPCSDEGSIHSVAGGTVTSFYFENDTSQPLQIIWLDGSGNRVTEVTLQPTYHWPSTPWIDSDTAWMIADDSSACQGIFTVQGNGDVIVN
jgi:hypothetical protein